MTKIITIEKKVERAFLIGVCSKLQSKDDYEYNMNELQQLAETAEIVVVQKFVQALDRPDIATLVGKGKLSEIIAQIEENKITTLVFNDNLSPSQARNIAEKTKCNIVDRTELILDIFAKHAQTYESRLQVELAQLEYSYSKLRHLWQHFSRIAGGAVGVRGPGETQIEIDRRLVRKRISLLKDKLLSIKKNTEIKRKKRADKIAVCLVGYTNAGKSTLFNKLTSENIYAADKLFATLDSTTRSFNCLPSQGGDASFCPPSQEGDDSFCPPSQGGVGGDVLTEITSDHSLHSTNSKPQTLMLTDTIGFIESLPPALIQSFYSTLYEVREADLLLHVVDVNNPKKELHIQTVNKILKDLKADDKDIILVFNKCDTLNSFVMETESEIDNIPPYNLKAYGVDRNSASYSINLVSLEPPMQMEAKFKDAIFISAKTGENIHLLHEKINNFISKRKVLKTFSIPANLENIISFLHNHTEIQSLDYIPETHIYECNTLIDNNIIKNIEEQLDKGRLLNFLDDKK